METTNNDLYKSRSLSGCMNATYTLLTTRTHKLLKGTWLPIVVCAVADTLLMLPYLPDKDMTIWGMAHPFITILVMALSGLLCVVANAWLVGSLFSLIGNLRYRQAFGRSCTLFGIELMLYLALYALIDYGSHKIIPLLIASKWLTSSMGDIGTALFVILPFLVFLVCLLPCIHSGIWYLTDAAARLSDLFGKQYKQGWKRWGFIFLTNVVIGLLLFCVSLICLLPLLIIGGAQITNQLGMLNGDADGAPGYMLLLLLFTSVISMAAVSYISMWAYTVNYYMMGSIVQHDKEKNQRGLTETQIAVQND